MTKLFNTAEFLMIKTVSELGSWSFRQVIKCKETEKKERNNSMSLIPVLPYSYFQTYKYILHRQQMREKGRESTGASFFKIMLNLRDAKPSGRSLTLNNKNENRQERKK